MTKPKINPYNFVPLRNGPERRAYPNRYRLQKDHISGVLECELEALSPLISLDQKSWEYYDQQDQNGNKTGTQIKVFSFRHNQEKKVTIQGTSLKGMIRTVYESITDSCLPLAAVATYGYDGLGEYDHANCNNLNTLCPACRLFGTIHSDVHCQGRVTFTDAHLVTTDRVIQQLRFLKELSSPKPHYIATYGLANPNLGTKPIAGRKFYYHQGESSAFWIEEKNANERSIAIREYVLPKAKFSFQVILENLEPAELGQLLLAIELGEGLGHKIGLGKAIGLGSCRIAVKCSRSSLEHGVGRYESWPNRKKASDWSALKADESILPPALVEILRINKPEEGDISYPISDSPTGYPQEPINMRGVFGGNATSYGKPSKPQQRSTKPLESPPNVKPDQKAVWLEAIYENKLVFRDTENKEETRKPSDFQGKKELLKVGQWYLFQGTKSVFLVKKKKE